MKKLFFVSIPLTAVIVWLMEGFLLNYFQDSSIQSNLAKLTGLLGIAFMVTSFVTSSRLEFIEKLFGGLDIAYKYHKLAGKIAYVFIFMHPVLLVLRRAVSIDSIKTFFVAGTTPSTTLNTGIVAFYVLSLLILFTLVLKLPYQFWKKTHRFMIVVFLLSSWHIIVAGNDISKVYGWILLVVGAFAFIYRDYIYGHFVKKKFYQVVDIKKLSVSTTEIFLKPLGKRLEFKPGQFVFMKFMNSKTIPSEAHPFSMASDNSKDIIRFSIKELGNYSEILDSAKPGDMVKLVGPHGKFTLDTSIKKQLWISGGIGTTPFLSMLHDALDTDIVFIHSNREESDAVYVREISGLLNKNSKLITHLSDIEGFINAEYFKKHVPDYLERTVYICGPFVMMHSLSKILQGLGVPKENIRFEDFNFK